MGFFDWFIGVKKLWDEWDIRAMMLLSLFLQTFLFLFGRRRRAITGIWVGFCVWLAYQSADWIATVSLGLLSRGQGVDGSETNSTHPKETELIPSFWASILLVHLGGPDTITAYSDEDNQLWKRHLLQLITQLVVASYVSVMSWWSKDPLIFVCVPVFISGINKYGERNWALRSASYDKVKVSANEEQKKLQAMLSSVDKSVRPVTFFEVTSETLDKILGLDKVMDDAKDIHEAYFLFRTSKLLFGNNRIKFLVHMSSYFLLRSKKYACDVFKLIEIELGFMFDALFTKLVTGESMHPRLTLRVISFLSSVSALLAFFLMTMHSHPYSKTNIIVSYLLLVGAFVLEFYSLMLLLFSDWCMYWLSKPGRLCANSIYRAVYSSRLTSFVKSSRRWKGSMPQYSLASSSSSTPVGRIMEIFGIQGWEVVGKELKELIFEYLLEKRARYALQMPYADPGKNDLTEILKERGEQVLRREGCLENMHWAVDKWEFQVNILVWHIATYVCYHIDSKKEGGVDHSDCKMSISLSNYMLYLLRALPVMLPKAFGEPDFKEIRSEMIYQQDAIWGSENRLEGWDDDLLGDVSEVVKGCKLARELQELEKSTDHWTSERKWKMVSQVWVEMLTYAAGQCEWREHVKVLKQGGELITFVAVIMSHLGLNEQCSL